MQNRISFCLVVMQVTKNLGVVVRGEVYNNNNQNLGFIVDLMLI